MGEPTYGLDFLLSLVASFCETCSAHSVPKLLLLDTRGHTSYMMIEVTLALALALGLGEKK